jgi:V8-like Glu-specific endopeptidase
MKTLFFSLVLLCGTLNAGTIDPQKRDNEYIEYGNRHKCVVKIAGSQNDGLNFFASAVIIEEQIILTAAHIAKDTKHAHIVFEDKTINIGFFIIPEEYDENKIGGNGYDISIGYLKNKVNLNFYPELYNEEDEINKICSISGFGITGNFDTGAKICDGQKRAGSNIIQKIEDELLICSAQDSPQTQLEFIISNGDSGGGLFINQKLAGINSSIYSKSGVLNSNRNTFSMHTRISRHYRWIKEIIEEIKDAKSNLGRTTGDNGE